MNALEITDAERVARAGLTWLAEPADTLLNLLIAGYGPVRTVQMIAAGELPEDAAAEDFQRSMVRWHSRWEELPEGDQLAEMLAPGIRLVCPGDPEWPGQLDDLELSRPYALWVRGPANLRLAWRKSVAIVGSRAATSYGSAMSSSIASGVAAEGWTVISGAAFGIDAAAHRGALKADGTTVAVLASGVDRPSPEAHAELLDAIAETGAVVSEYPPGRSPARERFLARNRIIAALATGTVVVEASTHSGSISTARHAFHLDRPLAAVPRLATSEQSTGCHEIIRNWGAALVTSAAEVITTLADG